MARASMLLYALETEEKRNRALTTARLLRSLRTQSSATILTEEQFRAHYRFSKSLYEELCSDLRPHMVSGQRRSKVTLESKVLTALSFFATGSYQKPIGISYLHGLSQPSVSNAIREVTTALNNVDILQKHVKFPQTQEERQFIINGCTDKSEALK